MPHKDPDGIVADSEGELAKPVEDLATVLRREQRRIAVIMLCLGVMIATIALVAGYFLFNFGDRIETNKDAVQTTEQKAAVAEDRADAAETKATETAKETRKARIGLRVVYRALRGQRGISGVPGARGQPGRAGISATPQAIFEQVTKYCAGPGDPCRGVAGADGVAGPTGAAGENTSVSPDQISAGVAAYCSQPEQPCKGPQGEPGETVTGPTGPPGADSTVQGPAGPQGPAGVSPAFSFTWTDPTTGASHTCNVPESGGVGNCT